MCVPFVPEGLLHAFRQKFIRDLCCFIHQVTIIIGNINVLQVPDSESFIYNAVELRCIVELSDHDFFMIPFSSALTVN